jgi:hypothetical protein
MLFPHAAMLAGFAYKGSRLSSVVRSERTASEGDALKEFTGTEIKEEALASIGDLKAAGPDVMPAVFYKKFWQMVGPKVQEEVLAVQNGGSMPVG